VASDGVLSRARKSTPVVIGGVWVKSVWVAWRLFVQRHIGGVEVWRMGGVEVWRMEVLFRRMGGVEVVLKRLS
jgi:hypothetical protein